MKKILSSFVWIAVLLVALCPASRAETRVADLESRVLITPILELSISETVQSELKFGNLSTSVLAPIPSAPKSVTLIINSNSGNKYLVTQSMSGPLENDEGQSIALENLRFRTVSEKGTGSVIEELTAVMTSNQTIFASNEQGTSETIQAEYQLTIPPSQAPGDYAALITYTVSSI